MRVGAICYATKSGLGFQALDFYKHGIVDKVLIMQHPHYKTYWDWYPQHFTIKNHCRFLHTIDVLLIFETAVNWNLAKIAESYHKRIVLMPNYEWTPKPLPVKVDRFICPSLLDLQYYPDRSCFIPMPVERPWKLRERALHFVHNGGHGGSKHRNGTPQLLEAMEYVKSPIKLTVRGQPGITFGKARRDEDRMPDLFAGFKPDPRVELVIGDVPDSELYSQGDVFVFPEQFNGLSLPLQEAWASGMPCIATNRFPINTWLPLQLLIPPDSYRKDHLAVTFDRAVVNPRAIAAKIDEVYNTDITALSVLGREWAEQHSWEVLKPQYLEALKG